MKTEDKIENACEWIEQLASNDYQPVRGQLAVGNRRCCLGVLRDVLGTEEKDGGGVLGTNSIRSVGLIHDKQKILASANDRGYIHSEIAMGLLENPRKFFEKNVADGITEYFRDNI